MNDRLRQSYQQHQAFFMLFLLFASFRILAILLFRPGGFITDFSDYDFYYTWGQLVPMGYAAYDNLWTAYPPLFPALMLRVFELSSRIPPWFEPRLFFHVLFGLTLLLFECGNLILIYRLGNRLGREDGVQPVLLSTGVPLAPGMIAASLYALFFVPLYTLLGWFEPMPLFFLLLSLELLLVGSAWGWTGSAVAAALGFLTKLTPIIMLPIAVRWLGARLTWTSMRSEWFNRRSSGNLLRVAAYVLLFVTVVVGVGYPFVSANPSLAFSSFTIQSIRPPWQSIWAIIDGFYGYGLVPLDMRNLEGLGNPLWESRIPWTVVSLLFLSLYLWLYTREYDWNRIRTPIAFTAVTVLLLFLYSKGWSPQFLLWVLVFIALLLPTVRGISIAIVLSFVNFVEADIFLILLPDEHWIMVGTVLTRTILLVALIGEFLSQIWIPATTGRIMRRWAAYVSWTVVVASIAGAAIAFPSASHAYQERRLAEHPCRDLVGYLQEQANWPTDTIITQQVEVWRDFYPWLRQEYEFKVLDGYSPVDQPAEEVVLERLDDIRASIDTSELLWIERNDVTESGSSPLAARSTFFASPDVTILEQQQYGACTIYRVGQLDAADALAVAQVEGGPVTLLNAETSVGNPGGSVRVALYWQAEQPVNESYTVFVQLLNENDELVAQQDNVPVQGLAPTNTWEPGKVIRDPYELALPPDLPPGDYRLYLGMYDDEGQRVNLQQADGTGADHITFVLEVK